MLSTLARLLLTASAIAPISVTYAWVALMQNQKVVAATAIGVGIVAFLSCIFVLGMAQSHLEKLPFRAQSVEPVDSENVGFMLVYLLPLFTDKIDTLNWSLWVPVIFIFTLTTATGFGYHFNPLLGILQWHFYKITSQSGVTYVLITKKHIRAAGQVMAVGQLTEYILLDMD